MARRQQLADRALRPAMRSPGRPIPARHVEREFWRLIAAGKSTEVGRAEKGLIITTGRFTREAVLEANRTSPVIDLIDGNRLCDLLKEFALGVTVTTRTIEDITVQQEFLVQFDVPSEAPATA